MSRTLRTGAKPDGRKPVPPGHRWEAAGGPGLWRLVKIPDPVPHPATCPLDGDTLLRFLTGVRADVAGMGPE